MNSESFSAIQYSDASRSGLSRPENLRIEKALGMVGTNKKALDIGAYNGAISKKIKALGNEVWATDATDAFSPEFSSAGIEFVKSNIEEKLPYEDNKFDVVFAGEVLEHLVNTDGFVEEIKRILKKDGYLILTTPNTASLARRILLLLGRNPFFEASFTHAGLRRNENPNHRQFNSWGRTGSNRRREQIYRTGKKLEKKRLRNSFDVEQRRKSIV
ncbi:MAG: Two-component response regulator [candidate division WWE3 bacterium GW2011_GWC1_42_102]|nr:MAG: Two-component response regulator [candidate division WWE3 bacterium GW2011_GWC1_42_102]